MKPFLATLLSFFICSLATAQTTAPLRVFIRGGPKTHGPGQHDHPRFLAEWKDLLQARGAKADGALQFPSPEQLDKTDVLVMYAAEAGTIGTEQRASLDKFLKRGGGLVAIHDAVCGTDAHWFKTLIGGAWEHRQSKWFEGEIAFYYQDNDHPITRGVSNFDFDDEIYWDLHFVEGVKVLASSYAPDKRNTRGGRILPSVYEIVPQMWIYERDNYRAFVSIPGHHHKTFSLPHYRAVLLRGIAWAGKREVDSLLSREELASLRYPEGGPTAPEKASASIKVHPEFNLSLIAAEPLIQKPISHDWDPSGRLWVAETPEYPAKVDKDRPARDKISILEDGDGDGMMDRKKVFYEGLELVTSMVLHGDGVIVSQAPDIYWLRDTDGDGKGDKKELLYTGFGTNDSHAVISNMRWGMDGWIYATVGYSRGDIKSGDGSRSFGKISDGVIRFKPDGSAMEQFSSKGSNTWGLDFAPDGELFFSQANGNHINHVVLPESILARGKSGRTTSFKTIEDHHQVAPIRDYTKQAYVQIDHVGGFTSASGAAIYDGGAWPEKFNYTYYVAEPTVNLVHQDVLKPQGATYLATKDRPEEFVASTDLWFRPVHQRVGPDGALYILDFYNQAAVHNDTRGPRHGPRNAAVRPDRDHYFGRIWKVQHKNATRVPSINLQTASVPDLVKALDHPNGWVRQSAQRLLREKGSGASALKEAADQGLDRLLKKASAELRKGARELAGVLITDKDKTALITAVEKSAVSAASTEGRVHSLWLLQNLGALKPAMLVAALKDTQPSVRKNAARIVSETGTSAGNLKELERALVPLLQETNGRVRLEAINALGAFATLEKTSVQALVRASLNLDDPWSQSALISTASKIPLDFIEASLEAPASTNLNSLITQLANTIGARQDSTGAATLINLIAARESSPIALKEAALTGLSQGLKPETKFASNAEFENSLRKLLNAPQPSLNIAVLPLVSRTESTGGLSAELDRVIQRLTGQLKNSSEPEEIRLRLATSLLGVRRLNSQIVPAVLNLLSTATSIPLRNRLIEALGNIPDKDLGQKLVPLYPDLPPEQQELLFAQLIKRADWANALLDSIKEKNIPLQLLGPGGIHRLRSHNDAAVSKRANSIIDELRGPEMKEKNALIATLTPAVEQAGNSVKGKEVFTRNCAGCHKFNGEGRELAPDLTGMGAHGPRELLVHILDPNRVVEPNFVAYSIETKDDEIHDGVIARENRTAVVLKNAVGEVEIPKENIRSRRSTGLSLMPLGFEAIGEEGLRDLMTFITGDDTRFRFVDLKTVFTADSQKGIYVSQESVRESVQFKKFGMIKAGEVPFEVVHPGKTVNGKNVIVLKGGNGFAKTLPQKVEVAGLGLKASRLHFLGGIGGWAYPCCGEDKHENLPVARVTVHYQNQARDEVVLKNGVEFADYIGQDEVPGSKAVPDVVSSGQVRTFSIPVRKDALIDKISIESFDNFVAPTFVAITAELGEGGKGSAHSAGASNSSTTKEKTSVTTPADILIVGGGSSHDFDRWYNKEDVSILSALGKKVRYTDKPDEILPALESATVLYLSNNQPLTNGAVRKAIFDFAQNGKGLLLVHPALWFNWKDWPEYNRVLVGGGSRSHDKYGEFEVTVTQPGHPLMRGVSEQFRIVDELYHHQTDPEGSAMEVLATGKNLTTGKSYPVMWITRHDQSRIVCLTLGHDGKAHEHPDFQKILKNSVQWLGKPR